MGAFTINLLTTQGIEFPSQNMFGFGEDCEKSECSDESESLSVFELAFSFCAIVAARSRNLRPDLVPLVFFFGIVLTNDLYSRRFHCPVYVVT